MFSESDTTAATITNLADFDFTPEMGAMYAGRPFPLRKGETISTNLTVAEHLAKHLAQQMLMRGAPTSDEEKKDPNGGGGRALWNPESITVLAAKLVKRIGNFEIPKALTKEEILTSNAVRFNEQAPELEKTIDATTYQDKKEVIDELKKRNITFDARANKATLEKLLATPE